MSKLVGELKGLVGKKRKVSEGTSSPAVLEVTPRAREDPPSVEVDVEHGSVGDFATSRSVERESSERVQNSGSVGMVELGEASGAIRPSANDPKGKEKVIVEEEEEAEDEDVPAVWARELGPELIHHLYSKADCKTFEDFTAGQWKANLAALVKPLLHATSLLLYESRHFAGMERSFKPSFVEDRELLEVKNRSLEEEIEKLRTQLAGVVKEKEEGENKFTKYNDELNTKVRDLEGQLKTKVLESKNLEAHLKNQTTQIKGLEHQTEKLGDVVDKLKAKALKHKRVALEHRHMLKQSGAFSFLNALKQMKVLNPSVDLQTTGAHPGYTVVEGQWMKKKKSTLMKMI